MKVKAYKSWRWAVKAAVKQKEATKDKWLTCFPQDSDGLYRVRRMTQEEKERAIRGESMNAIMRRVYSAAVVQQMNISSELFRRLRRA